MNTFKKIFAVFLIAIFAAACGSGTGPRQDQDQDLGGILDQAAIIVETLAGNGFRCLVNGPAANAEFDNPTSIATNEEGKIVITDTGNNLVRIYDPGQRSVVTYSISEKALSGSGCDDTEPDFTFEAVSLSGSSLAGLNQPTGIAVDGEGNVIIADRGNHVIRKLTPSGKLLTLAGSGEPGFADGPGQEAQFRFPTNVSVDKFGNILVADQSNHRIRVVSPSGEVSTIAGSGEAGYADGAAGDARFKGPTDAIMDAEGNVIVADRDNHLIRLIKSSGEVITLAGTGTAGFADGANHSARFNLPTGVALDSEGNIIVADFGNHRIREISLKTDEVSTVAGTGIAGFANGEGSSSRFNMPTDVLTDDEGGIVVADFGNHRIRKIQKVIVNME